MVNETFLRSFDFRYFDDLIEMICLHESFPVLPKTLYELFNVNVHRSIKMPPGYNAFSAMHLKQGFGVAVFDRELEGTALRREWFHEIGHLLFHKDGKVHGSVTSPSRWLKREELEADVVGCYLAAPGWAMLELFKSGFTALQVAELLDITPEMLQLRAELMVARDELGVMSKPFDIKL